MTHLIPPGTQVVIQTPIVDEVDQVKHPVGAVAIVIREVETGRFLLRFLDGYETYLTRDNIVTRKSLVSEGLAAELASDSYYDHIIYRCIVGSRAYGLDHDSSDIDWRGIYLAPAEQQWSLFGVPEQLENKEREECST